MTSESFTKNDDANPEEYGPECGLCGYDPCRCDEEFDPYEAAGERHGSLPGGGSL